MDRHILSTPLPVALYTRYPVSKMRQSYQVKCDLELNIERNDTSFRACLCTLLLLLALFGIISIFLWRFEEPKTLVSKKVSNHQPSSDSASWFGKIIRNKTKTTLPAQTADTRSHVSGSTMPSVRLTTDGEQSTSSVEESSSAAYILSSVKSSETTDSKTSEIGKQSSIYDVSMSTTDETTPASISLAVEDETKTTLSSYNLKESSAESLSTTVTSSKEVSDETMETLIYVSPKEENFSTSSSEPTILTSTDSSYEFSSRLLNASTLMFERMVKINEPTESPTTEKEFELTTRVISEKLSTNEVDTTTEESYSTTLTGETINLKESSAIDTTLDLTSADEVSTTSTTTTGTTTTTTAKVFSPQLTCSTVTCPTLSCPECPAATCPTMTTTTTTIPTTTIKPEVPVCKSSQCYVTAARILSLVNVTVDPCEDFYSYACGGMFNNPKLLEEDLESDVWKRIEKAVKNISTVSPGSHQNLKSFYNGCVNYDKLVTMEDRKKQGRKVLDDVAKFADASNDPENDFTELLIRLFQHGSRPLFDLKLDVDSSNSSQFQLVVTIPDWVHTHFHDRSERCRPSTVPPELITAYEDYKHCMGNFSDFIDTTQKALEFFGVFDYLPAYNASQLIQEIRISMEFDILELLREYPSPNVVNKDIQSKTYKLTPKIQLETELPMIAWSYLFSSLLNVEVSEAANVQVYFINSIKTFFSQLQTKSVRNVHNSLLAMFAHDLYADLVLTHEPCARERYCLQVTTRLMPVVTSNLYLESFPGHVDKELRKQVVLVYQQLEAAMEDKISKATWLDEKTSNEISKKLKFMSIQLPRRFNDSVLDSSIGKCALGGQQYLEDSACLLKHLQVQLYSRYTLDPHSAHAMWPHFLTAFSTKPAFIYGLNTFMIPLAAIGPVYDSQMPRHVVMATLGNTLARGIGHNFDHTGVKFVAGGKIGMMLSEATNPTYETVVENSNMQFSWTKSYREDGKIYSYLLDPELTLNQRLSDISAVNLSLSTVLDSTDSVLPWTPFSPAQIYFLALTQNFCSKRRMPEMFITLYEGASLLPFDRVFNLAANSEQFALAFRCPLGTTMNMASELKTRPFPTFEKEEPYTPDYA